MNNNHCVDQLDVITIQWEIVIALILRIMPVKRTTLSVLHRTMDHLPILSNMLTPFIDISVLTQLLPNPNEDASANRISNYRETVVRYRVPQSRDTHTRESHQISSAT